MPFSNRFRKYFSLLPPLPATRALFTVIQGECLKSETDGMDPGPLIHGLAMGQGVLGVNAFLIEEISQTDDMAGIQVNPSATDIVMVAGRPVELRGRNQAQRSKWGIH